MFSSGHHHRVDTYTLCWDIFCQNVQCNIHLSDKCKQNFPLCSLQFQSFIYGKLSSRSKLTLLLCSSDEVLMSFFTSCCKQMAKQLILETFYNTTIIA